MSEPNENEVWDSRWIQSILPHRHPILLVDRVLEIVPEKRIVAVKNVAANEDIFNGHFPGHPVFPGVLIVEGLAQTAGILLVKDRPDRGNKILYFVGIDRARFRRPVVPGDQLRYEIEVQRLRGTFCRVGARALVGDELAAEAVLSSSIVDR